MAQIFDIIALDVQLWDYATDKYIRARVYADGNEMPYSPVFVPHKNSGYYFRVDSEIFFPENTQHLSIVYEIYADAGFNTLSRRHAPVSEHYVKDNPVVGGDPEVIRKINQLIDIVTSHDVNSQIIGEISETFALEGFVVEEDVVGLLYDDPVLEGVVLDSELGSAINDNDDISGTLE